MRKADLIRKNLVQSVKNERNILAMANNPFVVRGARGLRAAWLSRPEPWQRRALCAAPGALLPMPCLVSHAQAPGKRALPSAARPAACPALPGQVRFYYSFTSRENLYIVMEYLSGGDLFSLLRNLGALDEEVARWVGGGWVLGAGGWGWELGAGAGARAAR